MVDIPDIILVTVINSRQPRGEKKHLFLDQVAHLTSERVEQQIKVQTCHLNVLLSFSLAMFELKFSRISTESIFIQEVNTKIITL